MSLEQKALRNDIESYLRGEQPPPEALAKAPSLEQWAVGIERTPDGGCAMRLHGVPYRHPRLPDGKQAATGELLWLDRRGRWARTWARVWKLGAPAGDTIPLDGVDV